MSKGVCPVCANQVVAAFGPDDSDILLIGSSPSDEDYASGRPFSGSAGGILRRGLHKAKIDMGACRQVFIWWHEKPTSKKANQDCYFISVEQCLKEMEGKKTIILIGALAVRHFTGLSVDDVNGLDVTSEVAEETAEGARYFALATPNTVFHDQGEWNFAIKNLISFMENKDV